MSILSSVKQRLPGVETAILLPADKLDKDLQGADYVLVSANLSLPPSGKVGVVMNEKDPVIIKEVSPGGAAAEAGIRAGDRIIAIDGQPIRLAGDVRLALLDKEPGQHLSLRVERPTATGAEQINAELTLQK
jgi:C-terminal processing protease CtpA/Prc